MSNFYVDNQGKYIGGFDGVEPPIGGLEVPHPPAHASHTWDGNSWIEQPLNIDDIINIIKGEAFRRIVRIVPEWKQRNLLARASELTMQVANGTPLTIAQQTEWDAGQALRDQLTAIRDKSDELEASISGLSLADLAAFNPVNDANWV